MHSRSRLLQLFTASHPSPRLAQAFALGWRSALAMVLASALAACATSPTPAPVSAASAPQSTAITPPTSLPQCPSCPACPAPVAPTQCPAPGPQTAPSPVPEAPVFSRADWSTLPGWHEDKLNEAWDGLLDSCQAMRKPATVEAWRSTCAAASALGRTPDQASVRQFMESHLSPWQVSNADGSKEGLLTGYYEPLIRGSRWKSKRFATPVYGVPDDMYVVDLSSIYPELKNMRLRGRIEGRKIVPYWTRAELEAGDKPVAAKVLLWAEDPIDFFFLQVQGSGQVELSDGSRVRIAYADQNGHPYTSIGRWLVQTKELKLEQAGMAGIKNWARNNPARLSEMLNQNASFVFFREEASKGEGPKGSLGVPLNAGRAIAVDPRTIPLGSPVFIAAQQPDGSGAINRLVLAQDTGGAIKGRVRGDFFWGFGEQAGRMAGNMRSRVQMWVLWPQGSTPPTELPPGLTSPP